MSDTTVRRDRWKDGFGGAATRSAQILIVLAAVTVFAYVGVQLRLVVVAVLIAVLLAAAANPLVDLIDRKAPRVLAVWVTLLLGLGVLGGLGYLVGNAVASQWGELRDGALQGFQQLQDLVESGALGLPDLDIEDITSQLESVLQGSAVQAGAITGATAVAQIVTGALLGFVVLFFLLKDGREIWAFFRAQLPLREHRRFDLVGIRSVEVLGGYVRGTATVASVDAVGIGVGLLIIGVPLALPLAVLTFVLAFVPVVGAVAAGAVAVLVALVSNGPTDALLVLGVVLLVQQLESNVLQPVLMGRYLSLHPLVILLALTAGSIVAGIIGAILAVPLAAVTWSAIVASRDAKADMRAVDEEVRQSGVLEDPELDRAPYAESKHVQTTHVETTSVGSTQATTRHVDSDGAAPEDAPARRRSLKARVLERLGR